VINIAASMRPASFSGIPLSCPRGSSREKQNNPAPHVFRTELDFIIVAFNCPVMGDRLVSSLLLLKPAFGCKCAGFFDPSDVSLRQRISGRFSEEDLERMAEDKPPQGVANHPARGLGHSFIFSDFASAALLSLAIAWYL
jgi:hypothetical protein